MVVLGLDRRGVFVDFFASGFFFVLLIVGTPVARVW